MCGRYALFQSGPQLGAEYGTVNLLDWNPRYNICPTEAVPVIRLDQGFRRQIHLASWGLKTQIRDNAKLLLNARAETVTEKPTFQNLARYSRCILPANGFYEWEKKHGQKIPWFFQIGDEKPQTMALAGLLKETAEDGKLQHEVAVLTTKPNALVASCHDRMPVIVPPKLLQDWLNPNLSFPASWALQPFPAERMQSRPVSSQLNQTDAEGEHLLTSNTPRQQALF